MNPPKILILDDEAHITHILCFKLEQAGAQVLSASDGQEGLDLVPQFNPDLIISDYQMPNMDGLHFAQAMAANPDTAHIPIIMLTARGHRIPNTSLVGTSIRYLLPKPFSIREVLDRVTEILPDAPLQTGVTHA
jgi:two-component system alkaline phosphatase synthesis response regulator PhoP